jgi:hypothetical protein
MKSLEEHSVAVKQSHKDFIKAGEEGTPERHCY